MTKARAFITLADDKVFVMLRFDWLIPTKTSTVIIELFPLKAVITYAYNSAKYRLIFPALWTTWRLECTLTQWRLVCTCPIPICSPSFQFPQWVHSWCHSICVIASFWSLLSKHPVKCHKDFESLLYHLSIQSLYPLCCGHKITMPNLFS